MSVTINPFGYVLFVRLVLPRRTAESIVSACAPKVKVTNCLGAGDFMTVTNQEVR